MECKTKYEGHCPEHEPLVYVHNDEPEVGFDLFAEVGFDVFEHVTSLCIVILQ